ncbi:MAG: 4Fe-4S dicluster domain-containing protein [Coriobacteriales bacterium]|jgi:ferredoxin-type protein NapG|nr:4Fe-4S dicluster domain-containing protein [Coriobacteriales bacterium]
MADNVTRRMLVTGAAGAAALLAIGGSVRLAFGATPLLRPPGGQDEARFIAACIKCDRCRSACPLNAVAVANLNDGLLNARMPKLDFHKGYCDFCNLCIESCPTGALRAFDPESEWIAPAVIDPELCIAFGRKGGCRVCVDGCPYKAIELDEYSRPVMVPHKCNGCGYCEFICPSNSYRSYSGTRERAIAVRYTAEKRAQKEGERR